MSKTLKGLLILINLYEEDEKLSTEDAKFLEQLKEEYDRKKPKRIYIKDNKHKSYKNSKEYKELNDKLIFSSQLDFNTIGWCGKTKKEILLQGHKEFLDKHNLTINNYRKIIEIL